MSVYVEMLVPYDFDSLSCKEKAIKELETIKTRLAAFFHISKEFVFDIEDYDGTEFEGENRYRLDLPIQVLDIELGNGYLMIGGGWKYSQYFYASGGKPWLRYTHFDVIRALGYSEAYVMDEYNGSNKLYPGDKEFGNYDMHFDVWKSVNPNPPILPMSALHDPKDDKWPEIESVYIDKFDDCKVRLKALQQKFPDYKILTIAPFSGDFILVLKDNQPAIINEINGDILNCGNIDGIKNRFHSAGFEIFHGSESAFLSCDGIQRTPFREGAFSWHWREGRELIIDVTDDNSGDVVYSKLV